MAVLYGTQTDGSLIPVQADAQGRLVAELAGVDQAVQGDLMVTGDVQMASLNSGPLAGFRNQLINGDFAVHQRGTIGAATAGYQTADRWRIDGSRASTIVAGPAEYPAALSASVAGETLSIRQGIELQLKPDDTPAQAPFLQNSVWTLSFDAVDASGSGGTVDASLGWASSTAVSGVLAHIPAAQKTLTSTWQRFSFSFIINTTSVDSSWRCLNCNITLTGSGTPRIAQVQLEPGPVATPFEHRPCGTELALCQRYFYDANLDSGNQEYIYVNSFSTTSNNRAVTVDHPVTMRTTPTVSLNLLVGSLNASTRYSADRTYLVVSAGDTTSGCVLDSYTADAEL